MTTIHAQFPHNVQMSLLKHCIITPRRFSRRQTSNLIVVPLFVCFLLHYGAYSQWCEPTSPVFSTKTLHQCQVDFFATGALERKGWNCQNHPLVIDHIMRYERPQSLASYDFKLVPDRNTIDITRYDLDNLINVINNGNPLRAVSILNSRSRSNSYGLPI